MKTAHYLLLAGAGLLLIWGGSSHGQGPATHEPAVVVRDANNLPGGVVSGSGSPTSGRDSEADQQVRSLLKKLGATKDEAAKTELQKQLTEALGKQFDVRQEVRERELKELEERVKRLHDVLERRQKAKDAIVRSRLDQLLREAEGLGWGDGPHDGRRFYLSPYGVVGTAAEPSKP